MLVDQRSLLRLGYALLVALGEDRFRCDTVHPDTMGTDLRGEVLGEDDYARLGGSIRDGRAGVWPSRGGGRHGDDIARLPCLHAGQNAFDGQKRGGEIVIERGMPPALVDLFEWAWLGEAAARVGDQNVDGPQLLLDPMAHRLDLGKSGGVRRD